MTITDEERDLRELIKTRIRQSNATWSTRPKYYLELGQAQKRILRNKRRYSNMDIRYVDVEDQVHVKKR